MNIEYLNTLPEVKNAFKVELEAGEKVVFTAKHVIFGTETQRALGYDTKITITNKRLIADNGAGVWTVDIAEDVTECFYFEKGKGLMRSKGYAMNLNKEVLCGDERDRIILTGYVFSFKKKDTPAFNDIVENVFGKGNERIE